MIHTAHLMWGFWRWFGGIPTPVSEEQARALEANSCKQPHRQRGGGQESLEMTFFEIFKPTCVQVHESALVRACLRFWMGSFWNDPIFSKELQLFSSQIHPVRPPPLICSSNAVPSPGSVAWAANSVLLPPLFTQAWYWAVYWNLLKLINSKRLFIPSDFTWFSNVKSLR